MSLLPYGLIELPVWGYALVTFVTIQTMFLGVTLYLHRDQSHRLFQLGHLIVRARAHAAHVAVLEQHGGATRLS